MKNKFTKAFSISSFDLNPRGQARLTTIANFFQEMAYHDAGKLGFGYEDMNQRQTMWVLSRMRIRINKYPVWDDLVHVETWHKGMDRLFGIRDFRVNDSNGNLLGMASSAWLILDIQTRRPVRPADDVLKQSQGDDSVFEEKLGKIQLPDNLEVITGREVRFSDLDIVGHVNNVKYMEWCIDAAMIQSDLQGEVRELEINFILEALHGDKVVISGTPLSGNDFPRESFFVVRREGNGQEIMRTRLILD